jgi:hypothetical protein
VAAPALRRLTWPAAAVAAAAALAALALHGERPGAGLARFTPEGPMVGLAPSEVTAVEIATAQGARRRFVRGERGGWRPAGAARAEGAPAEDIESGLKLLHASPPQRVLAPEDLAGTPLEEIGLAPPRLVVSVFARAGDAPAAFRIELGAPNPLGLARYARVEGRREILLLSRYVAEAWEKAAAAP